MLLLSFDQPAQKGMPSSSPGRSADASADRGGCGSYRRQPEAVRRSRKASRSVRRIRLQRPIRTLGSSPDLIYFSTVGRETCSSAAAPRTVKASRGQRGFGFAHHRLKLLHSWYSLREYYFSIPSFTRRYTLRNLALWKPMVQHRSPQKSKFAENCKGGNRNR